MRFGFPSCLTSGDFNGDGFQDLAVGGYVERALSVHLQRGGEFPLERSTLRPTEGAPTHALSADLNSDGELDIAASLEISGELAVLLNLGNGSGELNTTRRYGPGAQARWIEDPRYRKRSHER